MARLASCVQMAELAQEFVGSLPSPLDRGLTVICKDQATALAVQARLPGVQAVAAGGASAPAAKNLLFLGLEEAQVST